MIYVVALLKIQRNEKNLNIVVKYPFDFFSHIGQNASMQSIYVLRKYASDRYEYSAVTEQELLIKFS